jgi:hypothetical protein
VGLQAAFGKADGSGLVGREALQDFLVRHLAADNYIPESQLEAFRGAIWREYLRHRGEDFSPYYSEIEVIVRGGAGRRRDEFVRVLRSVLGDFELNPVVTFAPAVARGSDIELVINDEVLVRGPHSRRSFKEAVRRSISDW